MKYDKAVGSLAAVIITMWIATVEVMSQTMKLLLWLIVAFFIACLSFTVVMFGISEIDQLFTIYYLQS